MNSLDRDSDGRWRLTSDGSDEEEKKLREWISRPVNLRDVLPPSRFYERRFWSEVLPGAIPFVAIREKE